MKTQSISLYILLMVAVLYTACAGGANEQSRFNRRLASGFALDVLPQTYLDAKSQGQFYIAVENGRKGRVTVQVIVTGAERLRAVYFDLHYDALRVTPAAITPGPALNTLAAGNTVLALAVTSDPGVVHSGQVLPRCMEAQGFSGSGVVATIAFYPRPVRTNLRSVCTPPDTLLSSPVLALDDVSATLSWNYYNQGDYNQDGIVGISDLTPLGIRYGQIVTYPGELNTAQAVVDGNVDGLINIGDLAPIGINFSKRVQDWMIYSSMDAADYPASPGASNGAASLIGSIPQSAYSSSSNPVTDRVAYSLFLGTMNVNEHYWVRAADASSIEGTPSNMVTYIPGNRPPIAAISTYGAGGDGTSGMASHWVRFDASASSDLDGDVLYYSWDFDGDGTPDIPADTTPTAEYTYTVPGAYTPSVTVSDGALWDIASTGVSVEDPGSWHVQTLAGAGSDSGSNCSLAEINGNPAIAFRDEDYTAARLEYIEASDPLGAAWGSVIVLSAENPQWISLAKVNDAPAIAYYECHSPITNPMMNYTRFDPISSAWSGPFTIDADVDCGMYCSMVFYNGVPRVAYQRLYYLTSASMRFSNAADGYGDSWNAPQAIDDAPGIWYGTDISLADINGRLGISYVKDAGLHFAMATDNSATAWNAYTVHQVSGYDFGRSSSLAVIAGNPAIAYMDFLNNLVYYTRALDAAGTDWSGAKWQVSADASSHVSLAAIAGQPAIAFNKTDGSMIYMRSDTLLEFSGGDASFIEHPGSIGSTDPSLKEIGGHACLAFYNLDNEDLKFAAQY